MALVSPPLTFIDVFVRVDHLACSPALIIHPLTLILTTICVEHVHVCAFWEDILLPESAQLVSILLGQCTLAISQSFDEQALE